MMTTLGNPLLWITSSLAVVVTTIAGVFHLVKNRLKAFEHPLTPLLIGYFAFWLPWAFVNRIVFLYHYFPSYVFALLILAYWINYLWRTNRLLVVVYVAFVIFVALFYLPWAVGWIPVSLEQLKHMVIIQSWLY
jgi:dolichyl-phosphate-mannose-protein mannosyltransferase